MTSLVIVRSDSSPSKAATGVFGVCHLRLGFESASLGLAVADLTHPVSAFILCPAFGLSLRDGILPHCMASKIKFVESLWKGGSDEDR